MAEKMGADHVWPRALWFKIIFLLFIGQLALLFLLGEKKPAVPHALTNAPTLRLAEDSEWIALHDPTLFARPQPRDFAAAGCLSLPNLQIPSLRWTEPPRWLPLTVETLGAGFGTALADYFPVRPPLDFKPVPEISAPIPPPETAPGPVSTMELADALAQRRLMVAPDLSAWPSADVIAPSVVQVLVDASGGVVSAVLLESSGDLNADGQALARAGELRFHPASGLTVGRILFHWRTVPPASH